MEKLRAEAQRVKEVLSANTDIEARVEGILYDTYFSSKVCRCVVFSVVSNRVCLCFRCVSSHGRKPMIQVTRAEFEKMNAPLFTELLEPVKALLAANDLTVDDFESLLFALFVFCVDVCLSLTVCQVHNISEIQVIGGGARIPKVSGDEISRF
jgi:molecular chaperone DnaK (HSP70)